MNPLAKKLGLTSERFESYKMSSAASEEVEKAKKLDRSDLELSDWYKLGYAKADITKRLLEECPDQIDRIDCDKLSFQDFIENYEKSNKPLIIKGLTNDWKIKKYWTWEALYQRYKDEKFKIAEDDDGYPVRIKLKYYFEYLVNQQDDSPLYLFESSLEDRPEAKDMIKHYTVAEYFQDDIMKIMGEKKRPPFRWFLIGPTRSGTTIHIDPLGTSAWNSSLHGHKRWVLFPYHIPKDVVKGKKFLQPGEEYEAINYFDKILPKIKEEEGALLQPIEFIQYPGETVFIPGGWWHAVLNIDNTMALTQNIMTHNNFEVVWLSLRKERKKFSCRFLKKLKEKLPKLYIRALEYNKRDDYVMHDEKKLLKKRGLNESLDKKPENNGDYHDNNHHRSHSKSRSRSHHHRHRNNNNNEEIKKKTKLNNGESKNHNHDNYRHRSNSTSSSSSSSSN